LLVSLAFLSTSGFLILHALATPGVLLAGKNAGFQIASPIGLLLASLFAAASAGSLSSGTGAWLVHRRRALHALLATVLAAWGAVSLATLPPLEDPVTPEEVRGPLLALAVVGIGGYGFAAYRYFRVYRARPAPFLLSIVTAFVLLAEAAVAVAVARNWHATWWEWHLLILVAFGLVALSARAEWRTEGSPTEIFSDLYSETTRGHREQLSVLFADLQGFTSYSERTPEEEVKVMLEEYFGVAAPVVERHGSRIDQTIGDALMTTFRGDRHALRAARAGLELQQVFTSVADAHPGWPRFRVGINTGPAVVGVLSARGGRAHTVTGDTVNLAARLEGQARAGEVVIGEATRLSLGPAALTDELGELPIKGKERPVRAYVLRSLLPGRDEGDERLQDQEREPSC
jgi:adenylate cyclase